MLLKELLAEGVLHHKLNSIERGAGWLIVAKNLQTIFPVIEVIAQAVQDHYAVLERKHKNKMVQEDRASGIDVEELTEEEGLLEELININEETERRVEGENEIKKANIEKEKNQAVEMRLRAMEQHGETRKRNGGENSENQEKKRRKSGDTFQLLREKAAMEKELRENELKEKREECESREKEMSMFAFQMQTMQQQQQQQQQFFMMQQHTMGIIEQTTATNTSFGKFIQM